MFEHLICFSVLGNFSPVLLIFLNSSDEKNVSLDLCLLSFQKFEKKKLCFLWANFVPYLFNSSGI